jgi:hypothetical protein
MNLDDQTIGEGYTLQGKIIYTHQAADKSHLLEAN